MSDRHVCFAPEEERKLLGRVLASATFQKAPRVRAFLQFVGEAQLEGRASEINEYSIGLNVFEKSPDFNPAEDTIVRVSARQLRAKLKEYFEAEGKAEKLVLDIPRGSYVPVFEPRPEETAPAGRTAAS